MSAIDTAFPTAFYRSDKYTFPNTEIDEFNKLRANTNRNVGDNLTTKNSYILQLPTCTKIYDFCKKNLANYWHNIVQVRKDCTLEITQSWLNFNPQGTYHHQHIHSNSMVSGVFFIQGKGHFIAERGAPSHMFPMANLNYYKPNPFNSESWEMECQRGYLILFPSSTKHFVNKNKEKEERVSLSFNTRARGIMGKRETLTELVI